MGFFSNLFEKKISSIKWAITLTTPTIGTFYVDKKGANVCCAMDSSMSCGYTEENVAKVFNELKTINPTYQYEMVKI